MNETDPSFVKWLLGGAMTAISGAVGWVWRKADNAATKAELAAAIQAMNEGNRDARETSKVLFANAESDRKQNNTRFSEMQDRFLETHRDIHKSQVDLLIEVGKLK